MESRRNKRNSGLFEYHSQSIDRRTSKKTSSKDRHGQIYPDGFAETSIRAVTPDPSSGMDSDVSPAAPPRSTMPISPTSPPLRRESEGQIRRGPASSGPRGNGLSKYEVPDVVNRPRTRTLDERIREKSPTSIMSKTRSRIGSLQSTVPSTTKEFTDGLTSIGFPSIIPSPPLPLETHSIPRRPKAAPQPLSMPDALHAPIHTPPHSSPTTDTQKILQLMKITLGRMTGILSFRLSKTSTWTSGYCAINVATGSLIYQMKGDISHAKTLIPDLRGCSVRTMWDRESQTTFLDVSTCTSGLCIHLRPHVPETFDSWLAALLCWQPMRPKGVQNKMTKPQATIVPERKLGDRRRNSIINTSKEAAIIKVGKMLYWDATQASSHAATRSRRISTYKQQRLASTAWQKVSCTLQEDGKLRLFTETDTTLVASIQLSTLSRCAIQRLEPSVLDDEFSIAIYPQYTTSNADASSIRPIYLSLESRVLFEVWFVLLRAFTIADLYGPEQSVSSPESTTRGEGKEQRSISGNNMFRVERQLCTRVTEAKVHAARGPVQFDSSRPVREGSSHGHDTIAGDYYAETTLDGEVRARTVVKADTANPFWREDYEFLDLPPVLSSASILLKSRSTEQRDWKLIANEASDTENGDFDALNEGVIGDIEISTLDSVYGTVDLRLDDLERGKETEKWWPICNDRDEVVGEILMKVRTEEFVVLMSQEYQQLLELLTSFSTGLTQQIVAALPSELRRLSDTLLNIFQVSAQASDWIMSLVEDEIDGLHRDSPVSRFRYSRRIASNDSYDSGVERELLLRDLGKTAAIEANLLFRGNSLLTKALDFHMRRLGKEYLEDTLGERLRDIDESDPDCEVDPNRVQHTEILERNWANLITLTEDIWRSIYASASRCPPELRMIFRHIRACAEDRFGDFLRTVSYSSVSGFLFLRFFCPAVLNPKLFGLLKDHPRARAQRTLTLIAKSLQTLANLNTFGNKEPWMTPMNTFLSSHRQEFRTFIDTVCGITVDRATPAIPPSYATPIAILSRLPATSREGFPSLPYLIDQSREFAALVEIWMAGRDKEILRKGSDEIKKFDAMCEALSAKTRECLNMAEQAERPSGNLEVKWEELIERMARSTNPKPELVTATRSIRTRQSTSTTVTNTDSSTKGGSSTAGNSSAGSPIESYFDGNARPMGGYPTNGRYIIKPTSHGSDSDTGREPTPSGLSSSGVWDPGTLTRPGTRRRRLVLNPDSSAASSPGSPPDNDDYHAHIQSSTQLQHTTQIRTPPNEPANDGTGSQVSEDQEGSQRVSIDSSQYSLEATAGSAPSRSPTQTSPTGSRDGTHGIGTGIGVGMGMGVGRRGFGDVWGLRRKNGGLGPRGAAGRNVEGGSGLN
ncbi:MAG: hypothetical protein MMC33_001642 [Icmadophila ericetorum]|nr:hypothetical protein [Icmadophila ericetorum]